MEIYLSTISIEGSILKGENPLPIFRDREKDKQIQTDGTLNKESMENMGYEIGMHIIPYKLQDRYDRERKIVELKTVVIKNDKLKAVFLCEYGGRLYSLTDLETGKELLFKNPVFQLANLSTRNAWFSGGIEWNVSQFGHSLQTCEPLFFAIVHGEEDAEGSAQAILPFNAGLSKSAQIKEEIINLNKRRRVLKLLGEMLFNINKKNDDIFHSLSNDAKVLYNHITGKNLLDNGIIMSGFDKYKIVIADKQNQMRNVELLSSATKDAVYIAMRLSILTKIHQAGRLILLDDPFITFDNNRIKEALSFIKEYSNSDFYE